MKDRIGGAQAEIRGRFAQIQRLFSVSKREIAGRSCLDFASHNGGIVLNVSEGGLCFHSVAPVQREGAIRFWFSEHKQRIEADGEIAWIDETRKTGGLRFTALPAEGHEQIRDWISPPTMQLTVEKPPARSVPPPARSVPPPSPYPDFSAVPHETHVAPGGPVFPP